MYFEKSWLFIQEDEGEKSYAAIGKRATVLLSQVGKEIGMRKKRVGHVGGLYTVMFLSISYYCWIFIYIHNRDLIWAFRLR
jgi:hypothetical protein